MDEQLNYAPCGYFVLNAEWEIIEMNQTLKDALGLEKMPTYMQELLTVPSRIYFETYFLPAISIHKKVREMYLNFKLNNQTFPVLINVNERNGLYEGIIVQMRTRDEYENQLMMAKKNAERIQKETDIANEKLLALLQDVEEKQQQLKEMNEELQVLAARDELTGLFNRRTFRKDLAYAIEEARENGGPSISLIIFDIDYFKKVNDLYGHALGDSVLMELARKMESIIQPPDVVARIGGEEFAVILHETDMHEAVNKAEQLRKFIAESEWESIAITISVGIAHLQDGDTSNILFTRADDALYESKRNGRNQVTSR
ncbi:GGDEF domain-containing protein [Sporosarcina sp. Marseille-Q4943]|uniref:GGDEF domain-containing protein n=1 Tax=Sporosarcina sp. Marseille-Q4943 TaxID=2942204 RepID=UPI00208DCB69|nr:GGDEF domain-containing protein [Sporosarcina sp. Marseille-Q4943]